MSFYTTLGFKIFISLYAILGIVTTFLCYKTCKVNANKLIALWVLIGWLLPIIPYLYLRFRYKD